MNATGVDLSKLTDRQLRRFRAGWWRVYHRYFTMDKTVKDAIDAIDAELAKREPETLSKH